MLYFCLFIVLLLWFFITFEKVSKKAKVHGYLEPSSGIMRYTTPLQGQIQQILVEKRNGNGVERGTPLLEVVSEHALNHDNELHQGRLAELNTILDSIESLLKLSEKEVLHEKQHNYKLNRLPLVSNRLSRLSNAKK